MDSTHLVDESNPAGSCLSISRVSVDWKCTYVLCAVPVPSRIMSSNYSQTTSGEMIFFLPILGAVLTLANRALGPAIVQPVHTFISLAGRYYYLFGYILDYRSKAMLAAHFLDQFLPLHSSLFSLSFQYSVACSMSEDRARSNTGLLPHRLLCLY
jgi:hypothetical protein